MDTGWFLGCFAFHSALCLWPGKAANKGSVTWAPPHMWDTHKNLMSPDFDELGSGHCSHLVSEPTDGRTVCTPFFFVNMPF